MERNKLTSINGDNKKIIEPKISLNDMNRRLEEDRNNGFIRGEQWFRDANLWFGLVISYNNPYNHRKVHSELFLLHKEKKKLSDLIANHTQIIYGIGVGETEIELVDWELERSKYVEVVGIDVNERFIKKFIGGLKNKTKEDYNYQVLFKGYNALFEQLKAEDINFENSRCKKKAHICLGGTIGNYKDQNIIFELFSRNSNQGDILLIGFQLDTDIDILFKKYSTSENFSKFILNYEQNPDFSKLKWVFEKENGLIKATYRGIEVFRSRKYDPKKLREFISRYGFIQKAEVIDKDKNSCIQVYEKV